MIELTVAVVLAAAAAAGVTAIALGAHRPGWIREATRTRLLVHTRDGQTLDGQLVREDRDGLVLDPVMLADGGISVSGRVFVPRERVAWIQQPTQQDLADSAK